MNEQEAFKSLQRDSADPIFFFSLPSANPSLMCNISNALSSRDSRWFPERKYGDLQEEREGEPTERCFQNTQGLGVTGGLVPKALLKIASDHRYRLSIIIPHFPLVDV